MTQTVTPELLSRLLDEYGAALELFASQWTETPDDCVQEAFLQLVRQSKPPEQIVPWLFRVVRNRAISLRRSSQRRQRHESAAAMERPSWFQTETNSLIDDAKLTEALRSLSDEHREVIVAKIWGGLPYEQIAEVVGVSRSSAHRRYEAGLRILRERLGLTCQNEAVQNKTATSSLNSNVS
ncbi:MAG: sigma-70 family RNA polymerase sigma factor [Planctomycetes bacterium]|nr:sigma-70 family RNA polymerase sigma factor [Planctomycetota bacterium]